MLEMPLAVGVPFKELMGGKATHCRDTLSKVEDSYSTIRVKNKAHYYAEDYNFEGVTTDKLVPTIRAALDFKAVFAFNVRQVRVRVHRAKATVYLYDETEVTEAEFPNADWGVLRVQEGCYIGQIEHGKRHGLGTHTWSNGKVYRGTWLDDSMAGVGRLTSPTGESYEGHWEDSQACGHGVYTQADGLVYVGGWEGNLQQGEGEQITPEGHAYKGKFRRGKKHGVGELRLKVGSAWDVYRGEFAENLYDGQGEYTWSDGRFFTGSWKAGQMSGSGVYSWPKTLGRERYSGEYEAGLKQGFGIFTWSDGSQYKGEWSRGMRHGTGIFQTAVGSCYLQIWEQDVLMSSTQLTSECNDG